MNTLEAMSDAGLEFTGSYPDPFGAEEFQRRMQEWLRRKAAGEDEIKIETATSIHELDHERTRHALTRLISSFVTEGLSFDDHPEYKADPGSAVAAAVFLRQLPPEYRFPRVAPDDEGDIIMVWEANTTVLLTIEGRKLHIVIDPATPKSQHLPEVIFDGEVIPSTLLSHLPVR